MTKIILLLIIIIKMFPTVSLFVSTLVHPDSYNVSKINLMLAKLI